MRIRDWSSDVCSSDLIGPVGVISAFNFPVAVWCWNSALAFVCGDSVVWKPSEKAPLTALAVQAIVESVVKGFGEEAPKRSEEHTSELQSLMRISYAVFCLKKKRYSNQQTTESN